MDKRRNLFYNSHVQLVLVLVIVVLANLWAAGSFFRVDLTGQRIYSLELATRALVYQLDKPLVVKVYFTRGLQAPYNNHEQTVVDKLEDLRAYSKGLMSIELVDPTNVKELSDEAAGFGIQPIQYRYQSANVTEMKQVFMGLVMVYGDRQEVLPALTDLATLEYDLARGIKALTTKEERKVIGWAVGHGEPELINGQGPLETIRNRLGEDFGIRQVSLGGVGMIPEDVDALYVVGPQRPLDERSLYQLDQYLMRGGALAVFVSNTRPDLRTLRPQNVYHNLDALLGHYGVKVNRDVVVDRARNGSMRFPVRQGKYVVQMAVDYPLIPRATKLDPQSPVVRGIDNMLFPFTSSLTVVDPLPSELSATTLVATSEASGSIKGIGTIDPTAYKMVAPGEQRGSFPVMVSLAGTWTSFFASKEAPRPVEGAAATGDVEDAAGRLRESAPTRLVVAGSADFVANNIATILNLTDWLVQDESLIAIRSKNISLPAIEPVEPERARLIKLGNLLGGSLLLLIFGLLRWWSRRPPAAPAAAASTPGAP
jgi:gliding-associated putative ABC transporter substrate-binding component GldG